jgi:hypothetical protein
MKENRSVAVGCAKGTQGGEIAKYDMASLSLAAREKKWNQKCFYSEAKGFQSRFFLFVEEEK